MQDGPPPPLSVMSPLSTPPRRPKVEAPRPEPEVIIKERYIYVHVGAEEGANPHDNAGAENDLNRLVEENDVLMAKLKESEALLAAATQQLSQ